MMIEVPIESFRKFINMKKYMEEIKLPFSENFKFANWLITIFTIFRFWPFVFYKFLVYLFIC